MISREEGDEVGFNRGAGHWMESCHGKKTQVMEMNTADQHISCLECRANMQGKPSNIGAIWKRLTASRADETWHSGQDRAMMGVYEDQRTLASRISGRGIDVRS